VIEPGVKTWKTYLPKTPAGWYDYHTGKHFDGAQEVTTQVDKTYIPVFVRAGSILPLDEDGVLTIRIYPGKDGTFTLYEDDGESNDYEKGQRSEIMFFWNDKQKKLTIGERKGTYDGMPAQRMIKIEIVGGDQKTVTYQNQEISVNVK
jgi:alpha-D-xyloside xylohydrolase